MAEKETIRTDELRQFSAALDAMARSYSTLAEWLETNQITEIRGPGTPTAKRAMGYLGGFSGSVLKSLARSLTAGEVVADSVVGAMFSAEGAARAASASRLPGVTDAAKIIEKAERHVVKAKSLVKPKPTRKP